VAITALHDGKRVALFARWKDPVLNGAPIRVQDFQDGMALQFSLNGSTPFLGMGDNWTKTIINQRKENLWLVTSHC